MNKRTPCYPVVAAVVTVSLEAALALSVAAQLVQDALNDCELHELHKAKWPFFIFSGRMKIRVTWPPPSGCLSRPASAGVDNCAGQDRSSSQRRGDGRKNEGRHSTHQNVPLA